jgi:hypothetical protein
MIENDVNEARFSNQLNSVRSELNEFEIHANNRYSKVSDAKNNGWLSFRKERFAYTATRLLRMEGPSITKANPTYICKQKRGQQNLSLLDSPKVDQESLGACRLSAD